MKIYLAHNFAARLPLRTTVKLLEYLGHEVTSTWITDDNHLNINQEQSAIIDLQDIGRSDALILFVDQLGDRPGRGKYVELGYALGLSKQVYLLGKEDGCVFYSLPQVKRITSFEQLEKILV